MDYNELSWERQNSSRSTTELSALEIETMSRLMLELRDLTMSRTSYLAATEFLKKFGIDVDSNSLVRPEQTAH